MVNKHKINNLIESLKNLNKEEFGLGWWVKRDSNGTLVRCIAGQALILENWPEESISSREFNIFSEAANVLQINREQAKWLFYGDFAPDTDLENVTIEAAISALEIIRTCPTGSELSRYVIKKNGISTYLS
jgi:hypothetical protein